MDSEAVSILVMPFGVPDEAANTVWTIRGGYGDTADKIAGAIRAQFSAEKDAEAFFGKVTVKRVRTTFLMANSWHALISRLHSCSHRRSPKHAKSAKSPSSTFWVWPRNPEMSDTPSSNAVLSDVSAAFNSGITPGPTKD